MHFSDERFYITLFCKTDVFLHIFNKNTNKKQQQQQQPQQWQNFFRLHEVTITKDLIVPQLLVSEIQRVKQTEKGATGVKN